MQRIGNSFRRINRINTGPGDSTTVSVKKRYVGGKWYDAYYDLTLCKSKEAEPVKQPIEVLVAPKKGTKKDIPVVKLIDQPLEYHKPVTKEDKLIEAEKKRLKHIEKKLIASKIAKVLRGSGIQRL